MPAQLNQWSAREWNPVFVPLTDARCWNTYTPIDV